jgi:uncharacterized protein (DUF302 family)
MFSVLRNLLALIGLIAVALMVFAVVKFTPIAQTFSSFDEKSTEVYTEMIDKLVETGNMADATVWKIPVNEDLSPEDVEETMRFVANEHNIKNVGELPLSAQIEAMSGKKSRYLKIYMFCNAMTAANMLEFSDAFSAYLPCRISMVEDKQGKLWLYSLNMDAMIHGGKPLPAALKKEAEGVKEIILDIMNRGAEGYF